MVVDIIIVIIVIISIITLIIKTIIPIINGFCTGWGSWGAKPLDSSHKVLDTYGILSEAILSCKICMKCFSIAQSTVKEVRFRGAAPDHLSDILSF